MGRILIKGGIWKNTEDEILKAAVMKYGKNQWSRIASLLHRKSAKQCKSRWSEWLDPSIKKTEWSKEEEEKLLHLAKIFPTQWRTISSMIEGRTTEQCLEHYEEMLDRAQPDESKGEDDPRRLRPGEIDPKPETRPARPDPVDMDEDELEMLSEARARLANTHGKKAKRKAREKQLEEARRLASLQKRRELKMAGINIGIGGRKRKKGINYNTEIPFEKPVPVGVHDVSDEVWQKPDPNFKKLHQQHLDGELRTEKEEKERKKDAKKQEKKKESGVPIVVDPEATISKRSKLCLPAPRVTSTDLEETFKLVKSARASDAAVMGSGAASTDALRCDYPVTPTLPPSSSTTTTATPSSESILQETRNLIALQNVDTPLKGGENTPLVENPGFGSSLKTPSASSSRGILMITPFQTPGGQASEAATSSRSEVTTASTPLVHDHLGINPESTSAFDSERMAKEFQNQLRAQVKEAIASLPAPKNEFDLVFSDAAADDESVAAESVVLDQAELDAARERILAEQLEAEFARKSKAVQRDLPRPSLINNKVTRQTSDVPLSQLQEAEELIKQEMLLLLHHDADKDPASNQVSRSASEAFVDENPLREWPEERLKEAKALIEKEALFVKEKMGHSDLSDADYAKVWEECLTAILFLPENKRFVKVSDANKDERIDALRWHLKNNRDHMAKEAKKANKVEKKLNVLLGGYMSRSASLIKQLNEATEDIDTLRLQKTTFLKLKDHEQMAIEKRVSSLEDDVARQVAREKELQERYDALIRRREALLAAPQASTNGKS